MRLNEADLSGLAPAEGPDASRLAWMAVQAVLREPRWSDAAAALVSELATQLACKRVSLGWLQGVPGGKVEAGEKGPKAAGASGRRLRIAALSHGAQLSDHPSLGGLQEAMHEAISQGLSLCLPRTESGAARVMLAQRSLMRREGLLAVLTVPVAEAGEIVGALTCEREFGRFAPHEILLVEQVAAAAGPVLALKAEAQRPWRERLARRWAAWRAGAAGPQGRAWQAIGVGVVVAVAGLLSVPMPHRVTAQARVEGAVQRIVAAPLDGYLRQVHVRPGDVVRAGQVLAELSDEDLQWQVRSRQAEVAQQDNAFADAFARGDRAQAAIAQAKAAEARAQLALAQQQMARARLVAPFDGVVIAGDLTQRLGAPLKRSEALLTLSPLKDFRVVLEVDEREIAGVQPGQPARLLLSALPQQPIALTVTRITPVARTTEGRQRFEVTALPQGPAVPGVRPGLQGVAKIALAHEPWGLRLAREGWRALRYAWWAWV